MFKHFILILGVCFVVLRASPVYAQQAGGIVPCPDNYPGQVVALTNAYRQTYGRRPLTWNSELAQVAANHAYWMATANQLSHMDARGWRVRDRVDHSRYGEFAETVAENIANGHDTPEKVIAAWQASPSHNMALLLPQLEDIGVACFINPASHYRMFWVQVFANKVF